MQAQRSHRCFQCRSRVSFVVDCDSGSRSPHFSSSCLLACFKCYKQCSTKFLRHMHAMCSSVCFLVNVTVGASRLTSAVQTCLQGLNAENSAMQNMSDACTPSVPLSFSFFVEYDSGARRCSYACVRLMCAGSLSPQLPVTMSQHLWTRVRVHWEPSAPVTCVQV